MCIRDRSYCVRVQAEGQAIAIPGSNTFALFSILPPGRLSTANRAQIRSASRASNSRKPYRELEPRRTLSARLNVLIHAKQVRRIVLLLDLGQPRVVLTVRRPDAVVAFLLSLIHI